MLKNSEYWKQRFEQLEKASNQFGHQTFREIEPVFEKAQAQMQKEIETWYGRFAKNNQIDMAEARRLLNSSELKELKWDIQEYIKRGKESEVSGKWVKELENASAKYHINRLEALKLRTQQAAEVAYGNLLDSVDGMARRVFTENYYHSIFEIQKGLNIAWTVGQLDANKLNLLISKPWAADGKNFSERIWQSKRQLINEVHQQLTRTCVLGKSPDDAINAISKKFKTSKSQAGRLIQTEQAYFHSVSQKEAFNKLDVQEYEIVATLDSHTSEICQEMDGQHFLMKDYQAGVTAPPFHVWCRSVTAPYFSDNYNGERAAKGEDGKTYYVPDDLTYKDWKNRYKEYRDHVSEDIEKEFNKYSEILGSNSPTIEEFTEIKYNKINWDAFKAYAKSINKGELSPLTDFALYRKVSKEMDSKLIGVITSNNIKITGKSNHSIARVIGSVEQRRSGVSVDKVLNALTNKDSEVSQIREQGRGGRSQKFRKDKVMVSVNPDTGNIIQVNPVKD